MGAEGQSRGTGLHPASLTVPPGGRGGHWGSRRTDGPWGSPDKRPAAHRAELGMGGGHPGSSSRREERGLPRGRRTALRGQPRRRAAAALLLSEPVLLSRRPRVEPRQEWPPWVRPDLARCVPERRGRGRRGARQRLDDLEGVDAVRGHRAPCRGALRARQSGGQGSCRRAQGDRSFTPKGPRKRSDAKRDIDSLADGITASREPRGRTDGKKRAEGTGSRGSQGGGWGAAAAAPTAPAWEPAPQVPPPRLHSPAGRFAFRVTNDPSLPVASEALCFLTILGVRCPGTTARLSPAFPARPWPGGRGPGGTGAHRPGACAGSVPSDAALKGRQKVRWQNCPSGPGHHLQVGPAACSHWASPGPPLWGWTDDPSRRRLPQEAAVVPATSLWTGQGLFRLRRRRAILAPALARRQGGKGDPGPGVLPLQSREGGLGPRQDSLTGSGQWPRGRPHGAQEAGGWRLVGGWPLGPPGPTRSVVQASRAQGPPAAEPGARSGGGGARGPAPACPPSGRPGEPAAGPGTARTSPSLRASRRPPLPSTAPRTGRAGRGQKRRAPRLGTRVLGASQRPTDPGAHTVRLRATGTLRFQGRSQPGARVPRLASAPA